MKKNIISHRFSILKRKETKKYFSLFTLLFSLTFSAQTSLSTTENYVYSKNCMDADCIKKSESVQYFDGLGRPTQTVAIKATPQGSDVVVPIEYDPQGRQSKSYLPVPQAGTANGAIYSNPLGNASSAGYGSEKIYSEKHYDDLFAGRVSKVAPVGTAWSQKPMNMGYGTNVNGEVKKYTLTTSWTEGRTESGISLAASFAANQLAKTSVTDPDGNTTTQFKNGKGQILLVRKNDGSKNVDTYYLYNEYGKLVYVIPPLAVADTTPDQTLLDKLCYQYRYDGLGRLVEKKIPGKGWEYMIYDKQDRIVGIQDANLKAKGQWIYTKYDQFGRVAFTGINAGGERASEQSYAENFGSNNVSRTQSVFFNREGMDVYYDPNSTYPSVGWVKILSVNYYDTYPAYSFNPPFPSTVFGKPVMTDAQNASVNTQAMPTLSMVKNIDDDNWTKSYIYYDTKGRVISAYTLNHLGGYTRSDTELDFSGLATKSKTFHKRLSTDTERVISQSFEYDSQNRLMKHLHQVDNGPLELLTENTYNELSQLSNKKVAGGLESIDYQYDIRGAITKVNDPVALGSKLFGYELKYSNPQNTAASSAKYDGNITEVTWKTASDQILRQYNYQYDALSRLKNGIYSEPGASVPQNGLFNESLEYDLGGNITSLQRNGRSNTGTAQLIDNLTYTYTGNRLNTVTDTSGNYSGYPDTSGTPISYDDNGNMTDHADKGVLQIDYNFLDLPYYIKFNKGLPTRGGIINENVNYTYRADGTKVKKIYNYSPVDPLGTASTLTAKITEYSDGFQYETVTTKKGSGPLTLKFVPTAEGYYNFENNKYIYSYTDHLGNVRLSYSKNSNGSAEVLEENNYYPFGLKHEGYNTLAGNPAYNYQYGGKELQKETGWADHGARMYMSDIGRWGVIDPLAEMMSSHSPYNYVFNNPISFTDPSGMLPQLLTVQGPGEEGGDGHVGGWTNPNWVGFGNAGNYGGSYGFGYVGLSGGGSTSTSTSAYTTQGLLNTVFQEGGTWNNTGGSFWNGKDVRVGYAGNYQSDDGYIKIPEIKLTGSRFFYSMRIRNHVNNYMKAWNAGSDMAWDRLLNAGRYNDHGVTMIGGAGDPAGIFDIGGQVLSTWEPENKYLAMGVGIVGAIALRKPGLATKEANGAYFSVAYEMKLASTSYPGVYRGGHFLEANKALNSVMLSDARFSSSITDLGIVIPRSPTGAIVGKSPTNWVWHHNVEEGIMQLVPKPQHTVGSIFWKTMHPGNKGGYAIWGK